MERKIKTDLKFVFEDLGEMPEVREFSFTPTIKKSVKKVNVSDIRKPRKFNKDASTRLF